MKHPSVAGGIFLVAGNVIGAGILALPMALSGLSLFSASLLLIFFWLIMMVGAFYFLEVTLSFPCGANLLSMASKTVNRFWGSLIALCNLFVLYSLLSAYISGGGDLVQWIGRYLHLPQTPILSTWLFILLLGGFAVHSIHASDHVNRWLVTSKISILILLILGLIPFGEISYQLLFSTSTWSPPLLVVGLTSFGFSFIIPSLRTYYGSHIGKLKKIILFGTLIPLLCYLSWIFTLFSVLDKEELQQLAAAKNPIESLQSSLSLIFNEPWFGYAIALFTGICLCTSFLATSISLLDFLVDALPKKIQYKKSIAVLFTYIPTGIVGAIFPKLFLSALSCAGILMILQLLLFPLLLSWKLRERKNHGPFKVLGGTPLLILIGLVAVCLFVGAIVV